MDTRFGDTLNPDDFKSPFDQIVGDLTEKGRVLHELLTDYVRPQWKQRSLEILIVDNPLLNAFAMDHAGRDRICIFRGTLEHIYGNTLGLLSTPAFFPSIGDANVEVTPMNLPRGGFPRVPLLRDTSDAVQQTPAFFPNDQTRVTLALVLADLALEFLVYHEMGHILGGHLEIHQANHRLTTISEFAHAMNSSDDYTLQHVLECDADAFACHVTSLLLTSDEIAADVHGLVSPSKWQSKDFALLTYLMAIGILFRVLYPHAAVNISQCKSSHPHPAVRACLVAASTMARLLFNGSVTLNTLNDIMEDSVQNLEDVWAELLLPGKNPEPPELWAQNVGSAAMDLFGSYGNTRSLLDQYARLPRRWANWEWPET